MLLRTLGTFELVGPGADGQLVRILAGQKPLALVAYLACTPGRRATRDRLIDLLWRNVDADRARQTLRQTLWAVRQRLGDDAIVSDEEELVLAVPLDTDVARFEQAIRDGDEATAWALYEGPFIANFATTGSAGFEHWCDGLRDRLQLQWLTLGTSRIEALLQQNQPREAARVARRLRDVAPDQLTLWRSELRAWLAAGDRVEALVVAHALDRLVRDESLVLDTETKALLARVREASRDTAGGVERRPRPELVGRERTLASLLQGWRGITTSSDGRVAVVRGSAGIGKTRLLNEFAERLRESSALVVAIRARPGDRDVPYALASTLVEALAEAPGALGVSSASAGILVELAPVLSGVFRGVAPSRLAPDDLPRLRTSATLELLTCIVEEAPVALLIDDLHWADEQSRQLLTSLAERLAGRAVFLVVATRLTGQSWAVPEGAMYSDLTPLAVDQLEALLASMASAEEVLLRPLAELLHEVTGGSPMLALAALDYGLEQRVLEISGDQWLCRSLEELRRLVGHGGVLEKLLANLPSGSLAVLGALALCGGALEESVLVAASTDRHAIDTLQALAGRGLISRTAAGWEIAHDRMVDAVLAVVPEAERRMVRERTGRALLQLEPITTRQLQLAGRLLADAGMPAGGDTETRQAFRRWLHLRGETVLWQDPGRAAVTFLGHSAAPAQVTRLARQIWWPTRLWRGYPVLTRTLLAVLLLGAGMGAIVSSARLLEAPAVRMAIAPPETRGGFITVADSLLEAPITVPPLVIDFVDARGRVSRRTPDRVTLRLLVERGQVTVTGTMEQPVVRGRAIFSDLVIDGAGAYRLEAQASGLPVERTARLLSYSGSRREDIEQLKLLTGQINGQSVDSLRREVHATAGEFLDGTITIRTTSTERFASMLTGAIALWGDRRSNFLALKATQSFGESTELIPFRDALNGLRRLRAPVRPGRYPLLLVMRAETEMRFIASSTNWILETPRWNDGNDLADLPPEGIAQLRDRGFVQWKRLHRPFATLRPKNDPILLIGTVIDIVVDP